MSRPRARARAEGYTSLTAWLVDLAGADAGHADAAVRTRALRAVGRLQDSTTVAVVAPLLADRAATVRREAAFALGQIGHRSAGAALERALADRDPGVVADALEALGKLGDIAATPRLTAVLRTGTREQRMREMQGRGGPPVPGAELALPDRLDRMSQMMAERATQTKAMSEALKPLYATLSDEQKALVEKALRLAALDKEIPSA